MRLARWIVALILLAGLASAGAAATQPVRFWFRAYRVGPSGTKYWITSAAGATSYGKIRMFQTNTGSLSYPADSTHKKDAVFDAAADQWYFIPDSSGTYTAVEHGNSGSCPTCDSVIVNMQAIELKLQYVQTNEIASNAVTTAKVANGTLLPEDISASGALAGYVLKYLSPTSWQWAAASATGGTVTQVGGGTYVTATPGTPNATSYALDLNTTATDGRYINEGQATGTITTFSSTTANVGSAGNPGTVKIFNTSGNYIGLQAASGSWTSFNLQAPPTKGNNGDVLTSDGSGGTAFVTPSAGGVVQDVTAGNANITVAGSTAHPTVALALAQPIALTGTAALSGYSVTGQTAVYAGNAIQQGKVGLSDGSANWNYIWCPTGMSSDANFYLPATSATIGSAYDQLLVYKPGGTIRSIWDTGARLSYLELGSTSDASPGSITWWGPAGTGWSQSTTVKPSAAPTGNAAWTWLLPGTLSAGMPGRQLTIANYNNNPAAPVLTLEWGNAPGKMAGVPFEVVAADAAKKSEETFLVQYGDTLSGTSDVYTAVDTTKIVTETETSPVWFNNTVTVDGGTTFNSWMIVSGNVNIGGDLTVAGVLADEVETALLFSTGDATLTGSKTIIGNDTSGDSLRVEAKELHKGPASFSSTLAAVFGLTSSGAKTVVGDATTDSLTGLAAANLQSGYLKMGTAGRAGSTILSDGSSNTYTTTGPASSVNWTCPIAIWADTIRLNTTRAGGGDRRTSKYIAGLLATDIVDPHVPCYDCVGSSLTTNRYSFWAKNDSLCFCWYSTWDTYVGNVVIYRK